MSPHIRKVGHSYGKYILLIVATLLAIELALYGRLLGSLKDGVPDISGIFAGRSLLFALASAFFVYLVHVSRVAKKVERKLNLKKDRPWSQWQKRGAIAMLITALAPIGILAVNPDTFDQLSQEDVFIEPISALLFFLSTAFLLWQVWRIKGKQLRNKRLIIGICSLLAIVFFVIAMEEVSWFQRVLEIETPDNFTANAQGELNFHNFATDTFERLYYSSAFLYLVALPFLQIASVIPQRLSGLEVFIGNRFTLCVSSLFLAYNYDMWNAFSTQIPFFLTLFILLSLGKSSSKSPVRKIFFALAATLLIIQTGLFLWGHNMPRIWAATEYKEFFIAIGIFVSSLSIGQNLQMQRPLAE